MENLKQLIKESFDLIVKKRWLKEIESAVNSYNKSRDRLRRDTYVLSVLIKEYNERYPDSKLNAKSTEQLESTTARWLFWEGWIGNHDKRIEDATCSACGYKHPTVRRTYGSSETPQDVLNKLSNYCPNCGKPMIKNNN